MSTAWTGQAISRQTDRTRLQIVRRCGMCDLDLIGRHLLFVFCPAACGSKGVPKRPNTGACKLAHIRVSCGEEETDPGAGDASAFSAPGSVLYLSGHQPDFVYFPAFIRACFDEIRAVVLVQVDGSDGLLDDKCYHLSLPASMTTAHKSMRLTLSPPA